MDETGSDSLSTRIPYGRSWTIHVDEAYAERMIRAHNKAYRRKTGKGFFIFCLLLDALVVAGTVKCLVEGLNIFDAISGFEALLGGELDQYPEAAFSMVGTVDEVHKKAKDMGAL